MSATSGKPKQRVQANRKRSASPFGNNLKKLLEERNLTLRQAADLAGVEVSVIAGWTNGAMPGDPLALQRLCRALKADFEQLLTGSSSKAEISELSLSQIFEEAPLFDGLVHLTAKRLTRRGER